MLTGSLHLDGLDIEVLQVAPSGELFDDVLITRFPATSDEPAFVRLAVFDAAQNDVRPDAHATGHTAVSVARKWLRAEREALVGLHGAATELHNPLLPPDANPLTTAGWLDVRRAGDALEVLGAGRCADAEVILAEGSAYRRVFTEDMLNTWARRAFADSQEQARAKVPPARWPARRWHAAMHLLSPADWTNPPLGLTALPKPELQEGPGLPLVCTEAIVATDGLELDKALPAPGTLDLAAHLAALTTRTPPGGHPYPHGDIAAVSVRVG